MHYYQFHIGDYKSHTHHLSLMEDLAYRRLLDHYYLHQAPIKQREIARQIGMRDHEQEVLTVLNEFFLSTDDGYINPRADKEIKAYVEHQATSAYGAFVRDNPTLKSCVDKQMFVSHYMAGAIDEYVGFLRASSVVDVPIIGTSRVDDATTNQEPITNNHKPKKEKATSVATPDGVSDSVWEDFKALRKAKKAPVTQRALDAIKEEAKKADWQLEAALTECCLRGWTGFKAEWVKPKTFAQQAADVARTTVPPANTGPDPALVKIEQDRLKAVPMPDHIRNQIKSVMRKI